ncbi:MAG: hypothetical protein Q4B59_00890 [Lachnospiraceae bacterium]|nr:hypothetical protein [Lachnospiraceae bacterium]
MRNDREKKGLEFRKHGFGGESLRPAGRWTKKMGLVILGLVLGCSMQALAQSENTLFIWNEENCTLEDGLCTDWRVSRDGKRITFQVPEGQRWPDGKVMTAEAVRSRIETTLQESPFAGGLGVIDDMEVSGREVRLTLLHYSRELELYFSSSLFVRGDLEEEGFPAIVYLELNEDSENLKDRKVGEELVQLLDREALAEAAVSATMVAENEMEEPLESKNAEAKNTESKNVASENAIAEKAELEEGRERNLERDWRPAYSLISPGMMYYDSAEEEKLRAQLDRTWEKKKKEEKEKSYAYGGCAGCSCGSSNYVCGLRYGDRDVCSQAEEG